MQLFGWSSFARDEGDAVWKHQSLSFVKEETDVLESSDDTSTITYAAADINRNS